MEQFINLTLENIDDEHLCCAIADKKHQAGVENKKAWLKDRMKEGHVFRKLNAKGKVFIEYAPLEKAWVPVNGENYNYIYCLWVAGSFKGSGYGKHLIEYCIEDSKKQGKSGICTITSKKKKPYVSEKKFFEKYGFKVVDEIDNEYQLLSLSFDNTEPRFADNTKNQKIDNKDLTIYYSTQCPFTLNCIKEVKEYAETNNIKVVFEEVDSLEKAKNMPCVFNNWAIFLDGKFVSNTLLNANMLEKLLKK